MQGMIISNPRLEFLRPVLERWFDCIDRYNAVRGDSDTPYWHDEKANLGLLSAAAWMAELVTLQRHAHPQAERGRRAQCPRRSVSRRRRRPRLHSGHAALATGQQPQPDPSPAGHHQRRQTHQLRQRPQARLPVCRPAKSPAQRQPRRAAGHGRRPAKGTHLRRRLVFPLRLPQVAQRSRQLSPGHRRAVQGGPRLSS